MDEAPESGGGIETGEGRRLFGLDPGAYDRVRPDYPEWLFDALVANAALFPGAATLEIGAGSGIASRALLAAGAAPLTLLEPDTRFGGQLTRLKAEHPDVHIRAESFEEAELVAASADLIVAATAFHWLEPSSRVRRMAGIVRPGGHVALLWNVFGQPGVADPFHEATRSLLSELAVSPSGAPDEVPFALDRADREAEFRAAGCFELRLYAESRWTLRLSPDQVRQLYGGFSHIARLPAASRERLLDELQRIAEEDFAGAVERNMTAPLYLFRRQG